MTEPTQDLASEKDSILAELYDLEYANFDEDYTFYTEFARKFARKQRPALELGCGTGRLLLALASAGAPVVGVDCSPGMVERADRNIRDAGLQKLATAFEADMMDLGVETHGRYGLVFCALNTFAYLRTTHARERALNQARRALAPGGTLLIDLTPPFPDYLHPSDGETVLQSSFYMPGGAHVRKYVTGRLDFAEQLHHVALRYDVEEREYLREISQELSFRWTGRFEMELLLERSGFTAFNVYGGYELENFDERSSRMIFAASA